MKIQVLSAMYGRHKVVELALASWRKEGLDPIMVVSNDEDKGFCEEKNIKWIESPNQPLGDKWQSGVDYIKDNVECDAVLMLGSDDLIEGSDNYIKYLEDGYEFIGLGDVFIKDTLTGRVKHWQGYTNKRKGESAGAGRCFSRSLLDKLDWKLWEGLTKGLDGHLSIRLSKLNYKSINVASSEIKLTDLKDENSLTPFNRFKLPIIES